MSRRSVIVAAALCAAGVVDAQTWECVSASGNVTYTQTVPCSGDTRDVRVARAVPAAAPVAPPTTRVWAPGRGTGEIALYRGMPAGDVSAALGWPTTTDRLGGAVALEQWVYPHDVGTLYLYLRDGRVESWQAMSR